MGRTVPGSMAFSMRWEPSAGEFRRSNWKIVQTPLRKEVQRMFAYYSRSVRDLSDIVDRIDAVGAQIKSLKEPWLDTTTPHGRLLFTFFSGISEFERDLIRQRTLEGMAAARARGRLGGRPTLDPKQVDLAIKMYDSRACTVAEITKATGVSKSALYRYLSNRKVGKQ